MQNFEAIGRYVVAKEQIEKAAAKRNEVLKRLADMIQQATAEPEDGFAASVFDANFALVLLEEATRYNQQILEGVAHANAQVALCNRPRIHLAGKEESQWPEVASLSQPAK